MLKPMEFLAAEFGILSRTRELFAWDTERSWISPICAPAYAAIIETKRRRCVPRHRLWVATDHDVDDGLLLGDTMGAALAASAHGFFL